MVRFTCDQRELAISAIIRLLMSSPSIASALVMARSACCEQPLWFVRSRIFLRLSSCMAPCSATVVRGAMDAHATVVRGFFAGCWSEEDDAIVETPLPKCLNPMWLCVVLTYGNLHQTQAS